MNTAIVRVKKTSEWRFDRNLFLHPVVGILPLLLLPSAVFLQRESFPAWVFMWAMAMALSPDGRALLTGHEDGTLLVWPLAPKS